MVDYLFGSCFLDVVVDTGSGRSICISFPKLTENDVILYLLVRYNHNVRRDCNGNVRVYIYE